MSAVELYWIPLGAGGWFVRFNGRVYERILAALERRTPEQLFHAALIVRLGEASYAIELCPEARGDHGRVAGGPVGGKALGAARMFRYEARCWRGGEIPDLKYAIGAAQTISTEDAVARAVIDAAPLAPGLVWGRDEIGAGEMWNSNSFVAWLLTRAGIDVSALRPPPGGRAPGWSAGVVAAEREL